MSRLEPSTPEVRARERGAAGTPAGVPPLPPTAGRRGLSALRPFHHRSYAVVWSAGMVSVVGSWMQTVAVGALVVARTGQATWAVAVAAGGFLPIGVLSPVGGALADRLPRRPALVAGNLLAAAVALALGLLVFFGRDSPGGLTLLVTAQGCVSALVGPFEQAILPDLVPRADFLPAVSLNSAQFNIGRVLGPALAGVTVSAFGYPFAFLANSVSFLAVVAALGFVRLAPPLAPREPGGLLSALRAGGRAVRDEPACRAAVATIVVVGLLASPFIALVPAMAHHLAHGGGRRVASATALLTTAQGLGAVAGALSMAPIAARAGRGRLLLASLAVLPLSLVTYGFSPSLSFALPALFVVGFVYLNVLSGLSTVVQLRAPAAMRGRVLSFYMVGLGVSYPVGSLVQGPLADRLGLAPTTAVAVSLLAAFLVAVRLFRSRAVDALASPAPAEQQRAPASG